MNLRNCRQLGFEMALWFLFSGWCFLSRMFFTRLRILILGHSAGAGSAWPDRLLLLFPEDPGLQPVKIDIDDRRRIESENLRQCEAADDGVAERLAKLRSDSAAEHHRNATKQRRHRGHQEDKVDDKERGGYENRRA